MKKINPKLIYVLLGLISVFIVDVFVPLGVAIGILYVLCLLALLNIENTKSLYVFGVIATFLIILGIFVNDSEALNWKVILNRIISIIALWTIALIVAFYKNSILAQNLFLKQNQLKISLANTELLSKNRELEQFTYIASHDLQEPLRTISSYAEIIKDRYEDKLDDFGQKSISFIVEATERMSKLIKGLLDYSRIGKDKVAEKLDSKKLIQEISKDLETLISTSRASITTINLPVITGFKTDIRLLFQNFITNSIKFSKKNVSPQITIEGSENENEWIFSIKDNGIGIDSAYYDKIFIIFQRLHSKSEFEGTGIGLSHCQKIVTQHGGKIKVSSVVGEGTTFTFNLLKTKINDAQTKKHSTN